MLSFPRTFCRASLACVLTFAIMAGATGARAQGKLDARYTVTMTGITIGTGTWATDIGTDRYTAAASGGASGFLAVLISGKGSVNVEGAFRDGRPSPTSFTSQIARDDEKSEFKMALDNGKVTELDATAPSENADRVQLTDVHRRDIIDPLSAMLIPIAGTGEVVTQEACQRTLPIFDGRRRYDLVLSFKRMDKVKAERGYRGAVAVCAITLKPIAGYRKSSRLVKLLTQGREIELWLAPIAGTRVLVPFRLSIASMVGSMVVQATRFETSAAAGLRASLTTIRQPQ